MKAHFDLILISPEEGPKDEIGIVCQLFSNSLQVFHLRKPLWASAEMERFLQDLPKEFHNRIVLHSHFQLADIFKVKGIHLNENNKKSITQFDKYTIISASFHSLNDLKENRFSYEYIFLSPVFDSISKAGYSSKFDLKLLETELKILRQQNLFLPKVFALGGVNAQNVALVKEAGFSGAALLGAVWQNENPVNAFLEIQSICHGR